VWKGVVLVTIDGRTAEKTCTHEKKTEAAKLLKALQEK
jgi:hypothetical protein